MALPLTRSHPPLPSLGTAHTLFKLLKRILIAAEHQTVWKIAKSTSLIKDEIGQETMTSVLSHFGLDSSLLPCLFLKVQ